MFKRATGATADVCPKWSAPHLCRDLVAVKVGEVGAHDAVVQQCRSHHGDPVPLPQICAALHIRADQRQAIPWPCSPHAEFVRGVIMLQCWGQCISDSAAIRLKSFQLESKRAAFV